MLDQTKLIAALKDPNAYPHPVDQFEVIQTHISWVILTGPFAYKIKKPVNFGFLDFSTLERRRFYCEEELRLNRRLAPQLYLEVVPIRGNLAAPQLKGQGPIIEFALKLVQFSQSLRADHMLEQGQLSANHIDMLAVVMAQFHHNTSTALADTNFGSADVVIHAAIDNFLHLMQFSALIDKPLLDDLRNWTARRCDTLHAEFQQRKAQGYIRECHGDLHLANIVLLDGKPVAFDCIEFNQTLRWIDVISEIAFLAMDLNYRRRADLAWRFINAYLERSGDYAGLRVMQFYQCYRAVVRAKVALLQHSQLTRSAAPSEYPAQAMEYLQIAHACTIARPVFLVITHGLSGSGKTWLSQQISERYHAIRIRSDVERKRLFDTAPTSRNQASVNLYSDEASAHTYQHLAKLSCDILRSGYPVIVDSAFLRRDQRELFRSLADKLRIPFLIIDIQAPEPLLHSRIVKRIQTSNDASDADLNVLAHQIAVQEIFSAAEENQCLRINNDGSIDWCPIEQALDRLIKKAGNKS